MKQIDNVYIFVSDALRWDYLPKSVEKMGHVRKTVAASTLSPSSFATLTSGLYPPTHGVNTFVDQVPDGYNWLIETDKINSSFWQSFDDDPIYSVIRQDIDKKQRVDEMVTPFVNIERNLITHAPYGFRHDETSHTALDYLKRQSSNLHNLREEYRDGADRAVSVFEERIKQLDKNGVLDSTLVIFTSDHGELLGEYAGLSHTSPVVPEMIYVPTVFIHPGEIEPSLSTTISHVDINATILDVLDLNPNYKIEGHSVYSDAHRPFAYSGFEFPPRHSAFGENNSFSHRYRTSIHSLWSSNGGWVFNDSSYLSRIQGAVDHLNPFSATTRNVLQQNPRGAISFINKYMRDVSRFGEPPLNHAEAWSKINLILNRSITQTSQVELSEEQKKSLEDLGYI